MYTMMQVCRELDMTYQTLKFYCNEGLVPHVKRVATIAGFSMRRMSNGSKT